ncbi:MAG: hypothetical protein K6G54_08150 [Oscillospiraceae bacterium]|nr:hypothetical protein [Oscillospiraceae bacterium]
MEFSNRRKALYIAISVIASFALWYYVNSTSDVDLSLYDVPVEFLNAETALANKGFVLLDGNDTTVDLVLTMPRNIIFGFDPERLHVYANLISVNSTGSQSISYSIAYPPGISSSMISVKSPTVQTVSVRVGDLFRKNDVEIRVNLVGTVADGHAAGRVTTLPEVLEIWGQQSEVTRVSYAQVTLNIENAASTVNEQLSYELYDEDGVLIENSSIHSATNTVQVTMPVISAKDVPLTIDFLEEAGVRKESYDYALDVDKITLSGDASDLAEVSELLLGEVVLSEITEEQRISFAIPVPDGLNNLSGITQATLTIANRDVSTENYTVTNFGYDNFNDTERSVEVVTSSLNVVLRGAQGTLNAISSEDITAVADLKDVANASGTYTVPAIIRIKGEPDIGSMDVYQLTVRIQTPESGNTEEGESGAVDETAATEEAER